ncbi:MAG: DNA-directed RNA polymerase [Candidatus Methanomethylophilaceae archaeon]|nr:DNA-directed RNA polymerase [Candidatus Methanomethylophilaceae archaeon]
MYMQTQAERVVRIPPADLGSDIDAIIERIAQKTFEGRPGQDKSIIVLVNNVKRVGDGRIVHGDGAVYQNVTFDQIVFRFKDNELIGGVVQQVTKFGAFIRFGPMDGLLHVSQVLDDRVDADVENQRLVGKETGRSLSVGDRVRARIVGVELNEKNMLKSQIALTMRQPGLGRLDWIAEDNAKKGEA